MAAETTEKFFPFDSECVGGAYDREYKADDFARYYRAFITSGVFMTEATSLQVVEDGGMKVSVKAGAAIINGYRYDNTASLDKTLAAADGLQDRIDRVVVRWDKEEREIYIAVLEGELSDDPQAPAVTRTSDVIEYALADVLVEAGATEVTQAQITDKRMDSDVCGQAFPWATLDTSEFEAQYESWMRQATESGDAAMQALLAEMRGIIDDAAAGHLQNEIDEEKLIRRGYESSTTTFNADGSISTTMEDGAVNVTTFTADGSIASTLTSAEGVVVGSSTTTFNADGSITTTASRPTT